MNVYRWLTVVAAMAIITLGLLFLVGASSKAVAASADSCDMELVVELTPDVPNPEDVGFLSSLLSNQTAYRLTLRRQEDDDPSVLILELAGPGPAYRCQNVVEALRRDARVLSVRVDSDDTQAISVVTAPVPREKVSRLHVSRAGIGSLYWAARNPSQAWRVVVPVQPDDGAGAYEDARERCVFVTNVLAGTASCP